MSMTKTFQTLYKTSHLGKIQQWTIEVTDGAIKTTWGQKGGKLQETIDVIKEGKNLGKSNETTPNEQALAEAMSQWEKKLKKGYVKTLAAAKAGETDELILGGVPPMLSPNKSYPGDKDEIGKHVRFPCYGQPKLDGMRCIATVKKGKCTLWSRERRPILSVPHIIESIEKSVGKDFTANLDGELYNHEFKDQFEDLMSILRKDYPAEDGSYKLAQYHLYDYVSEGPGYQTRLIQLTEWDDWFEDPLHLVPTVVLKNWEEVDAFLDKCVEAGYEGCMLRNFEGHYESGRRSKNLIKCKFFLDGEFEIIGMEEGRGKLTGKIGKFICVTPEGVKFGAPLKMSHKRKQELFEHSEQWLNKYATVSYLRVTNDGSLYLPRVKGIRPKGDFAGQV